MNRYASDQREQTRLTILRTAARLFRNKGYNGVGINAIMREAGLTHGGFYHHFPSKQALLTEVLKWDHDFVDRMRARDPARLAEEGVQIAHDYLEPGHRGQVGPGCPFTTLTADVVRAGGDAQSAFAHTVQDLVREFERGLDDPQSDDPRALVAIAVCVGGLMLARGTDGTVLADRISRACQGAVQGLLLGEEGE